MTATLFENFTLFPPAVWLRELIEAAGATFPLRTVDECRWSYEVLDRKTSKLADVAIHARCGYEDFVVLVEAKRKNGPLKKTDVNPNSYLELDEFSWCKNRILIYLVDQDDLPRVSGNINDPENRSAVLSWQKLGGVQIMLAQTLDCPVQLRSFVAGSIQFQFCQHGITPSSLAHAYLADEPAKEYITKDNPGKMSNYYTPWRLAPSQGDPLLKE